MKKFLVILALFLSVQFLVHSEQLTTVGIVDISYVYNSFFSDSISVRSLEALRESIQRELDGHVAELRDLQQQKLEAESAGRQSDALQLDNQIYEKTEFIQEFQRIKQLQLQDRQNNLSNSETFFNQLQSAISFVAEENGYTIVLSSNDDNLIWWSQVVDITDLVLDRLRQQS